MAREPAREAAGGDPQDREEPRMIGRAAVIGAGVMGSGIAAHLANAGVSVLLLDIVPPDADNRNALAEGALAKLKKADPPAFMHKRNARLITPGNVEDHLHLLSDKDWIIEAVVERLDVKQDVYRRIDEARGSGSVVSSNTSTIPLEDLVEGLPESFARDFVITHFFNPPRYMRLLELVSGEHTDPEAVERIREFADVSLGKGVVECKDTPGFIANRIGAYWLQCAVTDAIANGVGVEEADAVLGRPTGAPKTGVFGVIDLVGVDLVPEISENLASRLPEDDPFQEVHGVPGIVSQMLENGYTGRKGKGGFYRLNTEGGKRAKEVVDLDSGEYAKARRPRPQAAQAAKRGGLRGLVEYPGRLGEYAWRVLARTLSYAASLVPEVTDSIVSVDEAMRLGYSWKKGPFEMIDELGPAWFAARLEEEGLPVPALLEQVGDGTFYRTEDGRLEVFTTGGEYVPVERRPGVLLLEDVKRTSEPLAQNSSAHLWDVGDGVLCLELHGPRDSLDQSSLEMMGTALETVGSGYEGLVVYSDGDNFSVGANIGVGLFAANIALWSVIKELVEAGQKAYTNLKYAPFPVVAAPAGMTLGGGCELALHSDAVQAAAETYMGLPEAGLGLVPSWGGCKELLLRWKNDPKRMKGPMPPVLQAFETTSMAKVAKSAEEAKELRFLRRRDGVTMNRDRLLADAKARVLELADGYEPPEPEMLTLPGLTGKAALDLAVADYRTAGKATPHDAVVSAYLGRVLSGGDTDITKEVSEDHVLSLEREAFTALIRHPDTLARVEHMLETGKPLRN